MKWSEPIGLLLMTTLCVVYSIPPGLTTTTRSTQPVGNTTDKMIFHLGDNSTTLDMILDTRTPPKVKQQVQNKMKMKDEIENSHAGVAIPVDEDALEMEETTKKLNFYKLERPTTNSGLSTWILLSGQASVTTKSPPTRKPIMKPTSEEKTSNNLTMVANDKPTRIVKPIFKQRQTTTIKPPTTTTEATTTTIKSTTKLTKVKASVLNTSSNKKTNTTVHNTTKKMVHINNVTTERPNSSTHMIVKKNMTTENTTALVSNSSDLALESKTDDVDLPNNDTKKKKPATKRKKNKNRRRKPAEKDSNSTSILKPTKIFKDKPISTQLYNYLAREVMPTVGVGLVGLMVTAGLAGYFLYPFGAARRNYNIDRKDKEGSYYYNDDYSSGMPEEEAIGKVIAGMPGNSLFANSYQPPSSKNNYLNPKYRLADRRAQIQRSPYGGMVQGTVENVPLTSGNQDEQTSYDKQSYQSDNYEPISYSSDLDSRYSPVTDKKFVVGNVPKEMITEVTPAAVPEHGPRNLNVQTDYAQDPSFIVGIGNVPAQRPRNLKIRRKRSDIPNDIENEIISVTDREETTPRNGEGEGDNRDSTTLLPESSSITGNSETTTINTETTTGLPDKVNSFIDLMKELIHFKAKIGLQMIQNVTQSISKYISRVQTRLDQQYRNYSKNKH